MRFLSFLLANAVAPEKTSWLDRFVAWVTDLMNVIGAPGVGIGIAIENIFPPIPSEILLPLAGFTAAAPDANFTPLEAIIWATVGSTVGALALYYVGAAIGHNRIVKIANKLPLVNGDDVNRTVLWFQKHGAKAVFFGRMLPIFRSLISIPAGIERMSIITFTLLTVAGSLIWNTLFILAGYFLGDRWEEVGHWVDRFKYLLIVALIVLFILWIFKRLAHLKRQ